MRMIGNGMPISQSSPPFIMVVASLCVRRTNSGT